jgi:hypothetical protein
MTKTANIKVPAEAFKKKHLDRDYHDALLSDLGHIAEVAGVPPSAVWSHVSTCCTASEMTWVRNLFHPSDCGLLFVGSNFKNLVADKMEVITGACLRNYIDARVMGIHEVINRLNNDDMPTPNVLLIPNFCMPKADNGTNTVAAWESNRLLGMLESRVRKDKKTILHVTSLGDVEKQYGEAFRLLLEAKFSIATPTGITKPVGYFSSNTVEEEA